MFHILVGVLVIWVYTFFNTFNCILTLKLCIFLYVSHISTTKTSGKNVNEILLCMYELFHQAVTIKIMLKRGKYSVLPLPLLESHATEIKALGHTDIHTKMFTIALLIKTEKKLL